MTAVGNHDDRDGPIADPIGSGKKPALTSRNDAIAAPNDGAHTGTTHNMRGTTQRAQRRDIEAIRDRLSERDNAILHSVAEHQFMTVSQVEAIHFPNHPPSVSDRLARRTLARLRRLRLLGALNRRIGGVRAGSAGMVYYIDVVGHQLLSGRSGHSIRGFREPTQRFVNHRLAVADAHVALVRAHQHRHFEVVSCVVEPTSWRRFAGNGGALFTLKADLYVETATTYGSEFVNDWFIEVDLGTETISTLLRKCRDYESYRQTGIEQDRHGAFPLVVWSITHPDPAKAERRRQALAAAIAADRRLPSALFRIVAPTGVLPLIQHGGTQ